MKYIVYIFAVIVVVAIFSCRPTRKIQTAIAKKDTAQVVMVDNAKVDSVKFINEVFKQLGKNHVDFKTFSAKVKVDYWDKDGKGPDLTVFIRVQKDSAIWLSINATVFSYEAFRVLITPDSIKVINKKDKLIQLRSVSYLQELTQLPFDFSIMQDLLIGNPVFFNNNIVSYKKSDSYLSLLCVGDFFKHLLTLNNDSYTLQHSKLDDVDALRNRTCDLTYGKYENKAGVVFSTYRKITVSEKAKLDVEMDFKQYSFNEILALPFSIPKNFKRD